jgi:Zn-dependent protease
MTLEHVDIVFQVIVFLFAISVHESSHAWMANRCGDPTARMLGRITLNPIKHVDLFGTILLPLMALLAHIPMLGWAKPTPVDPRNFKHPVRDDILTAVVGPISNFLVAGAATLLLVAVKHSSLFGLEVVTGVLMGEVPPDSNSILVPICLLLRELLLINVVLAVFNLIPVPPLDGSHVLRHFLPDTMRRAYDTVGWVALLALVYFGGSYLQRLLSPFLNFFYAIVGSA